MINPWTRVAWISDVVGYGVVADRLIPAGTITWARDPLDQVITRARYDQASTPVRDALDRFSYRLPEGSFLLCWDHARLMNHSCHPTCLSTGWEIDVAVRDIEPGEQLTCDYGYLNLEETLDCHCGHEACRGGIEPSDFGRFADAWDARVRSVVPRMLAVEQPLWKLVTNPSEVEAAVEDPALAPSIRAHHWDATTPSAREGVDEVPRRVRAHR